MVVILSLIRNLIMPSVGIVLRFFRRVDVLEDELMAEGNQNEQPPWVPVKMNEGKHSTDLSQLDQRNRAFTSVQRRFLSWWARCKTDYVHAGFEQE